MKKAPIVAITVAGTAVAAVVIAPTFIKPKVQEQLASWQEYVNQQPGYALALEKRSDGWFGSVYDAKLTYDMNAFAPELSDLTESGLVEVPMLITSSYGPVFLSGSLGVGLANINAQVDATQLPEDVQWDRTQPFYQIDVTQGFTGGFSYQDHIVSFNISEEGSPEEITFSGYQGHGSFSSGKLQANGHIDSVSLSGAQSGNASAEDYSFEFETETPLTEYFSGKMVDYTLKTKLERVGVDDLFNVSGITSDLSSKLDEQEDQGSVLVESKIAQIDIPELYQVENVLLTMELKNISAEFMRRYNEFVSETLIEAPSGQEQLIEQFLRDNLEIALAPKPEFNINEFSAEFDEGSFEFGAHSQLAAQQPVNIQRLLNDPMYWPQQIQADASFQMDQALLKALTARYIEQQLQPNLDMGYMTQEEFDQTVTETTEQMIQGFVMQGLLEGRDDVYVSNFVMEKGQATLNGSAMNI